MRFKCKLNSTTCNLNQKFNNKICQCECKNYRTWKRDYSWNPSARICENSKYLKSIADTSVIECDEIITAMGTGTSLINCHGKKVRDRFILHTVLLVGTSVT